MAGDLQPEEMKAVFAEPGVKSPIQSVALGAMMLVQLAVTETPASTLEGLAAIVAGGGVSTVKPALVASRVKPFAA